MPKSRRIPERELVMPALRHAARRGGFIKMADLIADLTEEFQPTGEDAEILNDRNDTRFSQKVRNLTSHKKTNFISLGYAEHDVKRRGLVITKAGREYIGF